ncbi:IclR family transcriptional regulator domain-containing protein [Aliirhizobium cellulosilyticum]|uniref:IclR family pca regulon transcriptional regulator n=1 Tax=Aliirhizobium cellulosilyticum TaxID=393664 RepID=A0A7W6THD1_9HYPH|nr:IclR family pca regulon transcriptional regulator [Rhizobium cellulosilyticum]MBB4412385.1 IclR family pca regulon transcriptional regulator [Rhizobium cellulosilyticum]MBB4447017.1 IclR family pca regulon transcriptional regulator [Rhizobium cellulosilyticum]
MTKADEEKQKPGYNYVQSLARGLNIIKSFNFSKKEQSLSDISEHTKLDRAVVRRNVLTLINLGYMVGKGGKYALTPRVLDLGFSYINSSPIFNLSQGVIDRLVSQSGNSCSIAVLDDCDVLHLKTSSIHHSSFGSARAGIRVPAYCTSMGRVLLSQLDDDEVRRILAQSEIKKLTSKTITDPSSLVEEIHKAGDKGWSFVSGEMEHDLNALSVPVKNGDGHITAVLNMSAYGEKIDRQSFIDSNLENMRRAAREISVLING